MTSRSETLGISAAAPLPPVFGRPRAFSLIELLISMAVLAVMLLFFATMTETVSSTWTSSEARVETYQTARGALELMTREMTPAVVDTRMQFVVMPGFILENEASASFIAPESLAALWIAPLGEKGDLRCVGYYLHRDDERNFYRLKRLLIAPDNPNGYFPPIYGVAADADNIDRDDAVDNIITSPEDATWFLGQSGDIERTDWDEDMFDDADPENDNFVVGTVADGVLALWFQCIDTLGNPIPWVSESDVHVQPGNDQQALIFNSAAFFQMATTLPFDTGGSTVYLASNAGEQRLAMKANRVPAAVDITIITIDRAVLVRRPIIPNQQNILIEDGDAAGTLDVDASIRAFQAELVEQNVTTSRTFTTRVKLINGT